jgi:hypothetical protein
VPAATVASLPYTDPGRSRHWPMSTRRHQPRLVAGTALRATGRPHRRRGDFFVFVNCTLNLSKFGCNLIRFD